MSKVDILAVGAHAGDAEIASGLALAHEANLGRRVGLLHLTLGEKGHPRMAAADYAALKEQEARAAADAIGGEVFFLPYSDGTLPVNDEVKMAIAEVIRSCRPDVIITHHSASIHKDHVSCHLNVLDAVFYAAVAGFEIGGDPHFCRTLYFAENWEDKEGFVPEVYLEVTQEDLGVWREMASCYALFRGEVTDFPYVDYYETLARLRGIENRSGYAVAMGIAPAARRRRVDHLV